MNKTITVAIKDLPPVLQVLLHKPTVDITLTNSITINACDMQWSGGSRSVYSIVELATGKVMPMHPFTYGDGLLEFHMHIDQGFVVVETGVFCGKPSSGHVYANAADVTAALPKPAPELTPMLQRVVKVIASYNSKGKERFRQDFRMSREMWDRHIVELTELGLCNKNGSLTVEGKNVARTIPNSLI